MTFEQTLKDDDLDRASAILDELAELPETGGLYMPECYADLARSCDHRGRHDDAIAAMERAIEHGWSGRPDGRSDIAEFHLRAGRIDRAAEIWAQLKAKDPDDVWLYNAAGLSYSEVGNHELAVAWLGEGIELAIHTHDPEGILAQLSDVRRSSLAALGREHDELEQRVDPFLEQWRADEHNRNRRFSLFSALEDAMPPTDAPLPRGHRGGEVPLALSWFPSGEYERAIDRWPDLAEEWAGVPHPDYCARLDGHAKWMRAHGVHVRAVAPIRVDDYTAWCAQHDEDPGEARAHYAAHRLADGEAVPWPPGRNEPCWCGSQRKYKSAADPRRQARCTTLKRSELGGARESRYTHEMGHGECQRSMVQRCCEPWPKRTRCLCSPQSSRRPVSGLPSARGTRSALPGRPSAECRGEPGCLSQPS